MYMCMYYVWVSAGCWDNRAEQKLLFDYPTLPLRTLLPLPRRTVGCSRCIQGLKSRRNRPEEVGQVWGACPRRRLQGKDGAGRAVHGHELLTTTAGGRDGAACSQHQRVVHSPEEAGLLTSTGGCAGRRRGKGPARH